MMFGGQTSKNVHNIRKVYLETTLCVLECFIDFYMCDLYKIDLGGHKLIYEHFCVGNIRANISNDHPWVLEEGPMSVAKTAKGSPTYGLKTTASGLVNAQ